MARQVDPNYLEELLAKGRAEADPMTEEVIGHLYRALTAVPPFRLQDGTECTVTPYFSPAPNNDGRMECGLDVHCGNGVDLEFTLTNTGWGKRVAAETAGRNQNRGQGR